MAKTILIVDDDFEDLKTLEKKLLGEGYVVLTSSDPEEAILQAKSAKPDLIILDEVMPKLFGSEVGMRLLQDPRTKNIPLLFLTSLKTPEDPSPSSAANVVIAKSDDTSELLEAIAQNI